MSRTEKLDELIARMYVHGMSTRDIEATFADVLSGTGVSKSVVSRVVRPTAYSGFSDALVWVREKKLVSTRPEACKGLRKKEKSQI